MEFCLGASHEIVFLAYFHFQFVQIKLAKLALLYTDRYLIQGLSLKFKSLPVMLTAHLSFCSVCKVVSKYILGINLYLVNFL